MFHYLFTNDLRITNLDSALKEAGRCFKDGCVPSASEDKNANNNMNTLGFYFNLTKDSVCAKEASRGNVRAVVLNFIKKFQFPNPRTDASFRDAINDGIIIAPMRVIISVLYTMYLSYPEHAFLTKKEIAEYIFFNEDVAKTTNPDIVGVVNSIISNRSSDDELNVSEDSVLEAKGCYWKQCRRQIREMVKVLTWAGCVMEDEKGLIRIHHSNLTRDNKADLFEILTYRGYWKPDAQKDFKYNKEMYQKYIDMESVDMNNTDIDYKEQKERFRTWLSEQKKANGEPYSVNSIASYISGMDRAYRQFEDYNGYESPFQIQDVSSAEEYMEYLFNAEGFDEFNVKAGNRACEYGWYKYKEFLGADEVEFIAPVYNTNIDIDTPRNRIYFGAPGTGKSYTINEDRKKLLGAENESDYERVTFHPDYSYANFVGTYKPVPKGNAITYEYVPGPFMRVYVQAIKSGRTTDVKPFLLIIEEINRANVAAVFGDIFQLLDRDENEVSEYPIQVSEDTKAYLARELGGKPADYSSIRIPNNMFIWATMNSADQGVFPMDTAFKRRWDFNYIGINNNQDKIDDKIVSLEVQSLGVAKELQTFKWNDLRKAINEMLGNLKVNEDKMLGTFFISNKVLGSGKVIDAEKFKEVFKSKVIMYLFEDAARQRRDEVFEGSKTDNKALKYSEICDDFDRRGVEIFNDQIVSAIKFLKNDSQEGE